MRQGGRILAELFAALKPRVQPGVTGRELDAWVSQEIKKRGAVATYTTPEVNFPGSICISVNDQIVHGIPTNTPFETGDIVSFDLVISYNDMKTDSAFTMVVGETPKGAVKHLITVTERSLYAAVDAVKGEGTRIGDISAAVEKTLAAGKLGIIRELVGHGIGQQMHMPPEVPNYGREGRGDLLQVGDTIAIEPMATLGGEKVVGEDDGWTISTRDGSLSAHFEHTILVTKDGAEILTEA